LGLAGGGRAHTLTAGCVITLVNDERTKADFSQAVVNDLGMSVFDVTVGGQGLAFVAK
jgi:hypothetical protein